MAGSSLDTKTYRSFSALFCRLERKRKVSIEKRKLNMWFVNERLIRQCAYRGAMITSAKLTSWYQIRLGGQVPLQTRPSAFGLAQGLVEVPLRLPR